MVLLIRALAFLAVSLAFVPTPGGAQGGPVSVSSGVTYELLARWDTDKLNTILTDDMPAFAGIPVSYTPARNAVKLYRVTYPSVVPERGNKPIIATGLLAVPDTTDTALPMVSYQHGTVYGKQQVPSYPDQSQETQLMLAQFAGQGYLVIGADYFGMGGSSEPEGYGVKASHQQATYDMLIASRAVLADMKLAATKLFLSGWSQGGFVTFAMLERLENLGIPVQAVGTASAPVDILPLLTGFLQFPRTIDADWASILYILTPFSFENYYGVPGLARSVIADEYYDVARKIYERKPFETSDVPTDLHKLVRAEYFDAQFFLNSAFGRLVAQTHAYRWVIRTSVRAYYGEADEVVRIELGRLPMTYQKTFGNDGVEAMSTGATTHRGTFAKAVSQWKTWFDSH